MKQDFTLFGRRLAMDTFWKKQVERVVEQALDEDLGQGDVTTEALIPDKLTGRGAIVVKEEGVLAGIGVAAMVFSRVDPSLELEELARDGQKVYPGDVVAAVDGKIASILRGERVALNFLQRLSGIASETAWYVAAVSSLKASILDTRKTTPGLRMLEKYAVRMGGGQNHRDSLGNGILIKDNHLAALASNGIGLAEAVKKTRHNVPNSLKIEVEVETVAQAQEAIESGADILLLDNMSIDDMRRVVELAQGRVITEASGGISLDTVRSVAETGVNCISIGALTHSVKVLDINLEMEMK